MPTWTFDAAACHPHGPRHSTLRQGYNAGMREAFVAGVLGIAWAALWSNQLWDYEIARGVTLAWRILHDSTMLVDCIHIHPLHANNQQEWGCQHCSCLQPLFVCPFGWCWRPGQTMTRMILVSCIGTYTWWTGGTCIWLCFRGTCCFCAAGVDFSGAHFRTWPPRPENDRWPPGRLIVCETPTSEVLNVVDFWLSQVWLFWLSTCGAWNLALVFGAILGFTCPEPREPRDWLGGQGWPETKSIKCYTLQV